LSFEVKLVIFYVVAFALFLVLRFRSNSAIARAAFTWMGPRPIVSDSWARYQLRWALYSLGWLAQIVLIFCVLWAASVWFPQVQNQVWWQVFWFALPLGAGMALLAAIGFLAKSAKARVLGPNPLYQLPADHDAMHSQDEQGPA